MIRPLDVVTVDLTGDGDPTDVRINDTILADARAVRVDRDALGEVLVTVTFRARVQAPENASERAAAATKPVPGPHTPAATETPAEPAPVTADVDTYCEDCGQHVVDRSDPDAQMWHIRWRRWLCESCHHVRMTAT